MYKMSSSVRHQNVASLLETRMSWKQIYTCMQPWGCIRLPYVWLARAEPTSTNQILVKADIEVESTTWDSFTVMCMFSANFIPCMNFLTSLHISFGWAEKHKCQIYHETGLFPQYLWPSWKLDMLKTCEKACFHQTSRQKRVIYIASPQ